MDNFNITKAVIAPADNKFVQLIMWTFGSQINC